MNQIIFYGVTKKYGDTDILLEQDFSLKDGLTFLVGKNGAGKTTLIRLSTGLEARRRAGRDASSSSRGRGRRTGARAQARPFPSAARRPAPC